MHRIIGLLVVAFLWAQPEKYPPKPKFPAFQFETPEGKPITDQNLPKAKPRIVIFFDPYCDHCQAQVKYLYEGKDRIKNWTFLWVSTEKPQAIQEFYTNYLKNLPNMYVARDSKFSFDATFGYAVVPTIFVYDAQGNLKKVFSQEVTAEQIEKALLN
ncbi:MAG: TlpA family protein disulfide reductase [Bacteroidia bacterium]